MLKAIKRNYFSLNPPQVDTLIFWLLDTSLISDNKSQHLVVGPLWHTHYFPFSSVFESSYLCLNLILSLQILSHVLASFYLKTLSTLGCWITKRKKKHYATRFGIRKDFFRVIMILSMAPFIYTSEEKYNTRLLKSYIAKRWKHSSIFTSVGWDQTLKIDYGMTIWPLYHRWEVARMSPTLSQLLWQYLGVLHPWVTPVWAFTGKSCHAILRVGKHHH